GSTLRHGGRRLRRAADERLRLVEHAARVLVRDHAHRLVERRPSARGDALGALRRGAAIARLDEEEVAGLVDEPAAEADAPVDDLDRRAKLERPEARLLADLAQCGGRRLLAVLEMALGEAPVAIR